MASAKGKGQPSIKHSCNFSESKRKLSRISDHEHDLEYPYTSQRHTRSSKLSQMLSRDALISAVDLMWDRSDSNLTSSLKDRDEEVTKFELSAEQKGNNNMSQLVRVSEKMCYTQNYMQSLFIGAKHNGFPLEGVVAPTVTRFHEGDAEIEKKESCTSGNVNEGHSNPIESRSPLLGSITEPSRSMDANSLFLLYKDRCANSRGVNPSKMSSCSGNNPHKDSLSVFGNKELLERDRKDQEDEVCSSSKETPTYAFAGALAGVSVSLCLHPLDTVKTMIQSCRLQDKSLCYTGRSIISERGVSGLYRGIASNIASSAPISALYTFTYESVKGALLPVFPKEYCSLAHCVAGGSASVATSFIFTPSERIKQQMQVSSHYRNCWTALVGIIQKGGLLSLYAGWSAVLCRNIPHSIIKFYVYENMKRMALPSIGPCGQAAQPTTLQTLVCGGLAGSAAAFFTTPFDVVKTRLQTQIPGSKIQHPSVYQALQSIRKQEGPRGLYRGLIPRLVMYMSQGAIFFASYEFYKSILSLEDLSARWHKTRGGDNPNPL
ncbi:Mitochondrial substrate carrier family protein [Raphanus sativus]|uniref:Probable mitochondrial adenine nucleotide transporter BTL2 n=1 Tax=Raphanus sativus TaxID=3726 RepID=A0A6J0KAX4_RAPSA|nr:probable mitochondrial adenine nucleotide transporter BTL2 [Raphanus sativus]KAJ4910091.1 Mitochondrial substrate carrier family protein [Raphanus sativus]